MWLVYEHRRVGKQLNKLLVEILKHYEKWKDIVLFSGLIRLKLIKGFRDEALRGDWKGFWSSRLGEQYRVIYKIVKHEVLVQVVSISPHDYRRK